MIINYKIEHYKTLIKKDYGTPGKTTDFIRPVIKKHFFNRKLLLQILFLSLLIITCFFMQKYGLILISLSIAFYGLRKDYLSIKEKVFSAFCQEVFENKLGEREVTIEHEELRMVLKEECFFAKINELNKTFEDKNTVIVANKNGLSFIIPKTKEAETIINKVLY